MRNRQISLFYFISIFVNAIFASFHLADNCKVFCTGPLLETVQNAHIFLDSKDFVDMPIKYDINTTLLAFTALKNKSDVAVIRAFVEDYFLPPGAELQSCHPTDFNLKPNSFMKIQDSNYRQWAYDIHAKWRHLCRSIKDDVRRRSQHYSLIPVPHPFIAPGGRFREFYYWDTYWIVKGLLASEMIVTAKNMIRNLGDMVRRFGFVPNGGRIYYLRRSQPPLFAGCVQEYYNHTGDLEFVREMLPWLEREFEFWNTERSFKWETPENETFQLYHYRVYQDAPRPESFKEDMFTTDHIQNVGEKIKIWSEIAAACESGWDFTTRWFAEDGPYKNNMRSIRTSRVVPVDLNAFLCWNNAILSQFHFALGNTNASEKYRRNYDRLKTAIKELFWDEEDGIWYDLDLDTMNRSKRYYPSNLTPLFAKCFDESLDVYRRTANYLHRVKADRYPGGLPSSLTWSGEQWDSPNGWAPTNHIIIEGLRKSTDPMIQEEAFLWAKKWIETNYEAFVRSNGKMFEKYNVEKLRHIAGGGGEYEVQEGFGWTNGIILDLLLTYGDRIQAPEVPPIVVRKECKLPAF